MGLKELQAFGRPANEVGLIHFELSESESPIDGPSRLVWREEGLDELRLYPEGKLLGLLTGISGEGVLEVSPTSSIEYALVGTGSNRSKVRYLTIEVDGKSVASADKRVCGKQPIILARWSQGITGLDRNPQSEQLNNEPQGVWT